MKKLRWFAITLFLLSVVLYALDQNQIRRKTDQTIPKISMDQDEIQVSVKDPEKVWKKGITAYDEKDGDITDSLVIESVSTFLEKGRRLVSYAAFDRDGHVAKASTRTIIRRKSPVQSHFLSRSGHRIFWIVSMRQTASTEISQIRWRSRGIRCFS